MTVLNQETALTNASNDPEFLAEIAVMFVEDAAVELNGLQTAIAAGDPEQIRFHAHTLKGMAGNLGGEELHLACLEAETAGRNGDIAAASTALLRIQSALSSFNEELKRYCKL